MCVCVLEREREREAVVVIGIKKGFREQMRDLGDNLLLKKTKDIN